MPSNRPPNQATLLVTVPMAQFEFIQKKVDSGKFISRQDYIRRLIDRTMEKERLEEPSTDGITV
jgi:Arc/MetJ-type ribon-helix-helix transcriptional regulator